MANSPVSRQQPQAPSDDDESSWTSYIRDFLEMEGISDGRGGDADSFTVTSDAGSCVGSRNCKKLMFRGRRRRRKAGGRDAGDDEDDDLEDTASSPVNSPKVSFLNDLVVSRERKEEDRRRNSQDGAGFVEKSKDAEEGMELSGRRYDYTELKKRGLRLVPVSMLRDYLK